MNRSLPYDIVVAVAAVSVWIAFLLKILTGGNKWSWMLQPLVPATVLTIITTVLLSRFWVARKKLPSFGTFMIVPFCCVFLISVLWDFKEVGWEIFTAHHWNPNPKVTWSRRLFAESLVGAICVFPAIAVVIYYHSRSKRYGSTAS